MKFKAFFRTSEHDVDIAATEGGYDVILDGRKLHVDSVRLDGSFLSLIIGGQSFDLSVRQQGLEEIVVRHGSYTRVVKIVDPLAVAAGASLVHSGRAEVVTTMPGRVLKLLVANGDQVGAGQPLIVLEAMKMENELTAPRAGTITEVSVKEGDTIETGAKVVVIE